MANETRQERRERIIHKNQVRQEVKMPDGSIKIVWHQKEFSKGQYAGYKSFWDMHNKAPKPKSKRQQKLKLLSE